MKPVGVITTAFLFLVLGTAVPACAQHEQQGENQREPEKQAQPEQQQRAQQPQAKPEQQQQRAQQPQPQNQDKQTQQRAQPQQQTENKQTQQHAQQPKQQDQNKQQQQKAQQQKAQQQQQTQDKQTQQRAQQPKQQDQNKQPQRSAQQTQNKQQPQPSAKQQLARQQKVTPAQQKLQSSAWQGHRASNWQSDHRTWGQRGGYRGYRIPDAYFSSYYGRGHGFRIYDLPFMVEGGYPRFQYGGYWFSCVDPWPGDWAANWYQTDNVYVDYVGDGYYLFDTRYPGVGIAVDISL